MELGAFSLSPAVQDIRASKQFYQQLGFEVAGGVEEDRWLILRNGRHVIGLFQGMFDQNVLTFNPGWDQDANELETFTDIREIQRTLKSQGVQLTSETDEAGEGPASFTLVDPDGNPILLDQHV